MRSLCNAATWLCVAACALCSAACGTLATDNGSAGGQSLSSGVGPFQRLSGDGERLLVDFAADLDDPEVLADANGGFTVYFTRRDGSGSTIRRARFASLGADPSIDTVLAADQPSEGGGISQPAVLAPASPGERWLLCYATDGGVIDCADSDDGSRFVNNGFELAVRPEPHRRFTSPALVRLDPRGFRELVRLFFVEDGALFAADLARGRAGWQFIGLDGLSDDPLIHRILAAGDAPWLSSIGRTTARTVITPANRTRYDLFLSGRLPGATGVRVVGLAASWDGLAFSLAAAPLLGTRPPDTWAPTAAVLDDGTNLLLFTEHAGGHTAIGAATAP